MCILSSLLLLSYIIFQLSDINSTFILQKLVKRLSDSQKKDVISADKEVFDIDIVKYEGLNSVKEYLASSGLDGNYPLGSLVFKPLYGV